MRLPLSFLLFAAGAMAQGGSGWIDLFPSENLDHWTRIAIPPANPVGPQQWKVDAARHVLICEGNGGHDMLRYDREFGDFVFHVEWRFTPVAGSPRYNSGVFIRNNANGTIWHQAQAGPGGGFLFGNTPLNGTAQRLNLRSELRQDRIKPAGEWNVFDTTCDGPKISLAVNGETTSEFTKCEVSKGYVALEAEGYRIEFREIRIKPLR